MASNQQIFNLPHSTRSFNTPIASQKTCVILFDLFVHHVLFFCDPKTVLAFSQTCRLAYHQVTNPHYFAGAALWKFLVEKERIGWEWGDALSFHPSIGNRYLSGFRTFIVLYNCLDKVWNRCGIDPLREPTASFAQQCGCSLLPLAPTDCQSGPVLRICDSHYYAALVNVGIRLPCWTSEFRLLRSPLHWCSPLYREHVHLYISCSYPPLGHIVRKNPRIPYEIILHHVAEHLDVKSTLSLATTCKFFYTQLCVDESPQRDAFWARKEEKEFSYWFDFSTDWARSLLDPYAPLSIFNSFNFLYVTSGSVMRSMYFSRTKVLAYMRMNWFVACWNDFNLSQQFGLYSYNSWHFVATDYARHFYHGELPKDHDPTQPISYPSIENLDYPFLKELVRETDMKIEEMRGAHPKKRKIFSIGSLNSSADWLNLVHTGAYKKLKKGASPQCGLAKCSECGQFNFYQDMFHVEGTFVCRACAPSSPLQFISMELYHDALRRHGHGVDAGSLLRKDQQFVGSCLNPAFAQCTCCSYVTRRQNMLCNDIEPGVLRYSSFTLTSQYPLFMCHGCLKLSTEGRLWGWRASLFLSDFDSK